MYNTSNIVWPEIQEYLEKHNLGHVTLKDPKVLEAYRSAVVSHIKPPKDIGMHVHLFSLENTMHYYVDIPKFINNLLELGYGKRA